MLSAHCARAPSRAIDDPRASGYIVGKAREDLNGIGYADHVGCTVVSVDYRMAPEFTYKEAVADCFAGLNWLVDNAAELGVDASRIAIGGGSAGGGLTAGLALYNRDNNGPAVVFQLLVYPMLDDTHETPSGSRSQRIPMFGIEMSALQSLEDVPWRRIRNGRRVQPYAAAARASRPDAACRQLMSRSGRRICFAMNRHRLRPAPDGGRHPDGTACCARHVSRRGGLHAGSRRQPAHAHGLSRAPLNAPLADPSERPASSRSH